MDARRLEQLIRKHVLTRLPGMQARGPLVFAVPVGYMLRGLYFEWSGFVRDSRRVHYFVMPLYVPGSTHVTFTFGRVLGGAFGGTGDHWWDFSADADATAAEIATAAAREAAPWLKTFRTPGDLTARAEEAGPARTDPYVRQAIAHSHILNGAIAAARAELTTLHEQVDGGDDRRPWLLAIGGLAQTVLDDLDESPSNAVRRLNGWRMESLSALRLREYAEPAPEPEPEP